MEGTVGLRVSSLTVGREWLFLSNTATVLRKDCEHGRHRPATEATEGRLYRHNCCFATTHGFQHTGASLQRRKQTRRDKRCRQAASRRACCRPGCVFLGCVGPFPVCVSSLFPLQQICFRCVLNLFFAHHVFFFFEKKLSSLFSAVRFFLHFNLVTVSGPSISFLVAAPSCTGLQTLQV